MTIEKMSPLVSIIIPVYNGANYMREAIDSALIQTYDNCEVLVINDGSTDNNETERIALSYGERIRYYTKENGGVATALNLGIEKMRGDYFSWLSHDDIYLPDKIAKQILSVKDIQTDRPVISVCNSRQIDKNGNFLKDMIIHPRASRSIRCFLAIDTETGLNGCSLLIQKELFSLCGKFDPEQKVTQDYDMWFRMAPNAEFIFIPDILLQQRIHPDQGSFKQYADITLDVCDKLHRKFISFLDINDVLQYTYDDYNYLYESYKSYKGSGFLRTASAVFSLLVKYNLKFHDNKAATTLIRDELFSGNQKKANLLIDIISKNTGKPKIVLYNSHWIKGGVERVSASLINQLYQYYDFSILTSNMDSKDDVYSLPDEVKIIIINKENNYLYNILLYVTILNANIFIGNSNHEIDFIPIYSLFVGTDIKTIAWNHSYYFMPKCDQYLYPLFIDRLKYLPYANVVPWTTTFSANTYAAIADNAAYMPNVNSFEEEQRTQKASEKILLCIARFDDKLKRVDRLLYAFKYVLDEIPDIKLILVGRYSLKSRIPNTDSPTILEILNNLKIKNSVEFTGEIDNVKEYYRKAKVFILTSEAEGFALVLNEAAQYGVPSVIFDIPGLDDIITNGVNGYIVPQNDLHGMAKKIIALFNDEELLLSMSNSAYEYSKRFSKKPICERWNNLFTLLLKNHEQDELNKYFYNEFLTPPQNISFFIERISSEYNEMLKIYFATYFKQSYTSESNLKNRQYMTSNEIQQLIKESYELVSNIQTIYSNILGETTQTQNLLISSNSMINNKSKKRNILSRAAIWLARKLFEPTKNLLTVLRLRNVVMSTKLYKKLRTKGVIDKLYRI